MGCAASSIDKEERVQVCKERKRLMKQLVGFRGEFADAQLAYLRALKNTGVTLRQFTESESLELENTTYGLASPPSPPPPLPPSPPPPPPFSPDLRKSNDNETKEITQESMEIEEDGNSTPPPRVQSSSWEYWDPFGHSLPSYPRKGEFVEPVEEENWAETRTEFEEDDREEEAVDNLAASTVPERLQPVELVDDNSSMMSWYTKDTADMGMVVWRKKKTLEGIVKDLDDYFLKASAGGKNIAVLLDISKGDSSLPQNFNENKRKRSSSAKVFSALSWNWSSKSLQFTRDAAEFSGSGEPCKPGAHCITLERLYAAELKLFKEVREEEITKLEYERKSMLLSKQEDENHDWSKTDKTRLIVESLETSISCLEHSISRTSSSMLQLIDEELYPQLVALTSGLMHMWQAMYACHQVQNHISQQLNHISDTQSMDLTTEYRHQATAQLETEVTCWYSYFCKLVKSQREYVRTLCRWIHLTDSLVDNHQQSHCLSAIRRLCEEWQIVFDRLPDKVASESIKSFLSAIQSIIQLQTEEHNLHKKYDKLEKRLQKELLSLAEMEKKLEGSFPADDAPSDLSPNHPLSLKRAKTEALKKRVETEKAKYLNSVEVTRTMTLSNLKTSLPNVFQALMVFSSASVQALEAIHGHLNPEISSEASQTSTN
ncbi:DUF632 domain-containing protein/DUF630 domain-containing protein [Cephalotus follicularis]|uniref:DUF632 domain-containing protein/DUF630 domain-containing protein n=1 Tax=Cephalotus follicularis TaxID=3775 RepID=A0A1Q3C893_CEPFO|nr:DUF632 domain-containing protein/DUF630 domain-containing protein [Cephalotus follicularis]